MINNLAAFVRRRSNDLSKRLRNNPNFIKHNAPPGSSAYLIKQRKAKNLNKKSIKVHNWNTLYGFKNYFR